MGEKTKYLEKFVIDSSFILAKLFPDEPTTKVAEEYFNNFSRGSTTFTAPILLKYEIGNALKTGVIRKRISKKKAKRTLEEFLTWPILYVNLDFTGTLNLAIDKNLSYYDASYLYLAKSNNLQLLTLDRKLASL